MSLTHGQNPRKHNIWTFAEEINESSHDYMHKCPCICLEHNSIIYLNSKLIIFAILHFPPTMMVAIMVLFSSYPLWDGQGCGTSNTCCSVSNLCANSPPWFIKHLSSSTSDNIEPRFCRPNTDGSTPIEVVELYVQ